jgi:hypothetical protein
VLVHRVLGVRHDDLVARPPEEVLHEEPGGVGRRGVLEDARRRHHEHGSVLGIDDGERVAPGPALQRGGGGAGGDHALLGVEHGHGVVDGAPDARLVELELLEVVPAVELPHLDDPGAHVAAEARVSDRDLSLPPGVGEVRPLPRGLVRGHGLRVVREEDQPGGGGDEVIVGIVEGLEAVGQLREVLRPVALQPPVLLHLAVVTDVGGGDHRGLGDAGLLVLREPLVGHLGGGPDVLAGHAGVRLLEAVADGGRRLRVVVGGVPGELFVLAGGLVEGRLPVERLRPRAERQREGADHTQDGPAPGHGEPPPHRNL